VAETGGVVAETGGAKKAYSHLILECIRVDITTHYIYNTYIGK